MRILVTNDDGVDSPGILALALALHRAGHEIVVVAPNSDRSGSSAAIGAVHRSGPIPFTEHDWPDFPDARVLSIDAPPATAVYAACLGGFGDPPDLVASGVNPGANTGHLVLHSGTVGAALTAAGLGVPGLAVSVQWDEEREYIWETPAAFAAAAVAWVVDPVAGPRVLNLNTPNLPLGEVRGVREARLAPYGTVWTASADTTSGDLLLEFKGNDVEPDPDTDLALVRAGYAAVSPLLGMERAPLAGAADAIAAAMG
ncbi:MAG TPA: 5'/3'-nucleotidase SurE [Acidimicrobiia bacterium]|nr:5'/3'-nucleotidase SurE [Acidimicrobiia bacterium]